MQVNWLFLDQAVWVLPFYTDCLLCVPEAGRTLPRMIVGSMRTRDVLIVVLKYELWELHSKTNAT